MNKYLKYAKEIISKNLSLFSITTIIIAITLILTTSAFFTFILANRFSSYLKANQKISILFDSNTPAVEIENFINKYKDNPAVSDIYQKKPEEVMQEYVPADYPIAPDDMIKIVRIDLKTDTDTKPLIDSINQEQASDKNIIEVIYLPDLYHKLHIVSNWINIISLGLLLVFGLIALTLIYLTLKLGMEKLQDEILIMKNIGAPRGFIQKPLFLTTTYMTLLGGLIGSTLTLLFTIISMYTLKASNLYEIVQSFIQSLNAGKYFNIITLTIILVGEILILTFAGLIFTKVITLRLLKVKKHKQNTL